MLKVKRIVCLLSIISLFDTYNINTITPFNALATNVVEDKDTNMILKDKMDLGKHSIEIHSEKMLQKFLEENKDEENNNKPEWREFTLTFYTSLDCENSSAGAVTCENKPLIPGGVANNVIPQNTKIYLADFGQVVVNDKGSGKYFNVDNRLDVFIERKPGESDRQYARRVNNYGVQKVQGYIIK